MRNGSSITSNIASESGGGGGNFDLNSLTTITIEAGSATGNTSNNCGPGTVSNCPD